MNHAERIETVRARMAEAFVDAMFLTPSGDLEYVTGVRRQRPHPTDSHMFGDVLYGVLITQDRVMAIVPYMARDFMERQLAGKPWISDVVFMPDGVDVPDEGVAVFRRLGLEKSRIAVPKRAPAMTLIELKQRFPEMQFCSSTAIIGPLRAIKSPEELAVMEEAARITDAVFRSVVRQLKVGMTEAEVVHEIEWQVRQHGAEGVSFQTGVFCRSPRTAAGVDDQVNRSGTVVLHHGASLAFDMGVVYEGYCSDFGRTVYIGEPSKKFQEIHRIVAEAQRLAMEAMVAGQIDGAGADAVAREYITKQGYGDAFFHRLGHGIGIDVHEPPFLSSWERTTLQEGMTVTVEPIVWLPEECLIRVEDVVVVTAAGARSLHREPTFDLTVID